mmetsp:Transcript_17589/g.33165  ORF Transcript_17589/g.33165 Transcript_17589/m.33165 type:complete len:214 (+) Transcript_17589:630-1271(+)
MGPSIASPMAYTEGTAVWKWSLTSMRPMRSVPMPSSSSPMFDVKGRRPVLTRTTSASNTVVSPPAAGSRLTSTLPSARTTVLVTFVLSLKSKPCFLRIFWKFLAISLSRVGVMESRNSTTVTFEPRRAQTDPISRPITPPPMTTRLSGTLEICRAPVESTILPPSLSTTAVGRGVTSEPTARMMFLASMVSEPPALRSTLTELGPESLPNPLT